MSLFASAKSLPSSADSDVQSIPTSIENPFPSGRKWHPTAASQRVSVAMVVTLSVPLASGRRIARSAVGLS